MSVEIETVVGHMLVVGGRAVSVQPPGALAETAPKRAPRAREGNAFFILVTPAGSPTAPAAFYEDLARLAADSYFGSGGGITGGLREALAAVNDRITATPPPVQQVNALALVLHGEELYAARSGAMFAALRQGSELTLLPGDRHDPLAMGIPPLGAGPVPDIQLARYAVAPGQAILVSDAGLQDADDDGLQLALTGDTPAAITSQLKALAGPMAAASVIQFVAPGTQAEDAATPQAAVPRPMTPRLPRRASQTPPAASPAEAEAPTADNNTPPPETTRRALPSTANFALKVRETVRDVIRAILSGVLAVTNFFSNLLNTLLPAPDEEGKQGIPTNVAVGLAILIPVVIVVVVVGLALSNQGRSDFEITLDRAKKAHQDALALSSGTCDNPALRPSWVEVQQLADQAARYRPNDVNVLQIHADAQNYLDCFDKVERRNLTVLHEFPAGADLIGPIVNGGVDLYTLDRTSGAVYHDTLNESGTSLTTSDSAPIIRRGQAVGQYVVGDLFDIEWLTSGGTVHDNVLIGVDRSGILVSYSPTFFASAQQLVVDGRWIDPVAIAIFRSNLYVLDAGANQIWRYVPPAGERRYSNAPEEYFIGNQPNLSGAVDMGISEDGAVFVLFNDGHILKYRRNTQEIAEEQPFEYDQVSEGTIVSGSALFVDNDAASRHLYIMDALSQTIYETSWAGRFSTGFRPNNVPEAFRGLTGLYADAVVRNNMYVVSGNVLYHFFRSE